MPAKIKKSLSPQSVEEFLQKQEIPYPIQELTHKLRAIIKEAVPGVIEAVYPGWKLIGYRVRDGKNDFYMGYLFPSKEKVVMGFEYGILLSDPHKLLSGEGNQVRSIEVKPGKDIRVKAFSLLIQDAARIAIEKSARNQIREKRKADASRRISQ